MLKLMAFPQSFIELVVKCISSTSFSFQINEVPFGNLKPTRGLRQGDPILPYLFLIFAEGLSTLIRRAERRGSISGLSICRNAPVISHLLFVDDSLVLFKANAVECQEVHDLLACYEKVSGQQVNFDKSNISFSKGVKED